MQYRNATVVTTVGALLAVLAAAPRPAEAGWTIQQNFTGASQSDAEFGSFPPDNGGAVGPNNFVEFVNGRVSVFDKTGALVQGITLDDFWRNGGLTLAPGFAGSAFDPHIVYDANSGHWFAAALAEENSATSRFLVGVSNTSDPTQGWQAFDYSVDPSGLRAGDFTTLGYNKDGVYVGADLVPIDSSSNLSTQTALLAINKANLIAGAPTGTLFGNIDANGTGFFPQPVVNLDNGPAPELIYSAYSSSATDGFLKRSQIAGPGEGNLLDVAGGFLDVAPYDTADPAHQPGGDNTIDTGSFELMSSVIELNGEIWGVHAVQNGGHAGLRWFRLDAGTGALEEEGTIGDGTSDYYNGSIAVNPAGFIVIGYTRSSDTEFASAYASTGFFDGTTTTFDAPLLLQAGTVAYDQSAPPDNVNRWGDFSATTVDPSNPKNFWTVQEWANSPDTWTTQITELHDPTPDPPLTPEPSSMALLAAGVLPLLRRRRAGA
jgi:MYXO-CTERM domain-containing protein